jgi:hypothetical protein
MGKRDKPTIEALCDAVYPGRFQINSDGFAPCKNSIPGTFGIAWTTRCLSRFTKPRRKASGSLRVTWAMAHEIADHVWSITELLA